MKIIFCRLKKTYNFKKKRNSKLISLSLLKKLKKLNIGVLHLIFLKKKIYSMCLVCFFEKRNTNIWSKTLPYNYSFSHNSRKICLPSLL